VLAARDGADGGLAPASSRRNPSRSLYALSAMTARNAVPHPAADRLVRADRQLGAEPRSCFSFVKGRAWVS
jgi:hypothetical protein